MSTYTTPITLNIWIGPQKSTVNLFDFAKHFLRLDSRIKEWNLWKEEVKEPLEATCSQHLITRNFTYSDLFNSFNKSLDELCLSFDEIKYICRNLTLPLAPGSTYFLVHSEENFFVVRFWIRKGDKKGDLYVYEIEDEDVWSSDSLPQLFIRDQAEK